MNKNIFNYKRLKNARIYRGLTASEVANQIGISKQAFSKYEVENTNLPIEKAIKISKILNFPLDYFFQNEYIDISNKSVYFRSLLTTNKRCKEEQIVKMKYLSILYSILDEYVLFPSLNIPIELENYTPEYASNRLRELWNLNTKPINNIISIVEKNGIIVAKFDTNTDEIDAFSTLINLENRNLYLIALNKNKKYAARIHFDVAHELGHILLDEWNEDIETLDREEFKKREKRANEFASSFLLPKDEFYKDVSLYPSNLNYYIELKKKWKVSISAMIYRARVLEIITQYQFQNLFKKMNYQDILKQEPLDNILQTSEPSLLNDAIDILLNNNVFTKQELLDEFNLHGFSMYREDIETLLNLEKDKLKPDENEKINFVQLRK